MWTEYLTLKVLNDFKSTDYTLMINDSECTLTSAY